MGLAEKRLVKELKENIVPEAAQAIASAIGKPLTISINWDSFESKEQLSEIQHQCLGRLVEGLEHVVRDDLGKEALTEALNTIVINNINDSDAKKISIVGDSLIIDANWEDYSYGIFTSNTYSDQIEQAL